MINQSSPEVGPCWTLRLPLVSPHLQQEAALHPPTSAGALADEEGCVAKSAC